MNIFIENEVIDFLSIIEENGMELIPPTQKLYCTWIKFMLIKVVVNKLELLDYFDRHLLDEFYPSYEKLHLIKMRNLRTDKEFEGDTFFDVTLRESLLKECHFDRESRKRLFFNQKTMNAFFDGLQGCVENILSKERKKGLFSYIDDLSERMNSEDEVYVETIILNYIQLYCTKEKYKDIITDSMSNEFSIEKQLVKLIICPSREYLTLFFKTALYEKDIFNSKEISIDIKYHKLKIMFQ
jgi:hypothetical protein